MAGDVIAGLGGVRKLRFASKGRGKSGGFRVIYYVLTDSLPVLALLIYGKNEQGDLSPAQHRVVSALAAAMKTGSKIMTEDTELGRELIASMQEAVAILKGTKTAARVHLAPGDIDVRALRRTLGLTRSGFAQRFGLAVTAVRDWEQGLRRPDPAARVLLTVIARSPDTVAEAVAEAQTV